MTHRVVGYEFLREQLKTSAFPLGRVAKVASVSRVTALQDHLAVPASVAPSGDAPLDHLQFALKHEGLQLESEFLQRFDVAFRATDDAIDMNNIDLVFLVRSCLQNGMVLSKGRRRQLLARGLTLICWNRPGGSSMKHWRWATATGLTPVGKPQALPGGGWLAALEGRLLDSL